MCDPIDYILSEMEKRSLTRRDLEPAFGSRARVCEVLNKKRKLTLRMIRALHKLFRLSAVRLIQDYELEGSDIMEREND